MEFQIKSNSSDICLHFSDIKRNCFTARVVSDHLSAMVSVWAYSDSHGLADLLEILAGYERPWEDEMDWESLEGEFRLIASCSSIGRVTFTARFRTFYGEEWTAETLIYSEMGQLPVFAKDARAFFGRSPY